MYLFVKSMAFFWTLAEAAILVAVRWGFHLAAGREGGPRGIAAAVVGTSALGVLLFLGEPLIGRFLDLDERLVRSLYRWGLWNFFCTVWVVLEGCIMIYVLRLGRMLRAETALSGKRSPPTSEPLASLALLTGGLLLLYGSYQAGLLHAVDRFELGPGPVARVSLFYIRVCGVFWIVFEWVVAVEGIRAYRALKRQGA
jgi:hypothetical protein